MNLFSYFVRLATTAALLFCPTAVFAASFYPQTTDGVFPSANFTWGGSGTYQITVANLDSQTEVLTFDLYLSPTATIGNAADVLLSSSQPFSLGSQKGQTISGGITIPATIPAGFVSGTNYLIATISVNGSVVAGEYYTINIVTGAADLVGTQTAFGYQGLNYSYGFNTQQSSALWGQTIGLEWEVIDQGSGNANPFVIRYYLSETDNFGTGNTPNPNAIELTPNFSTNYILGSGLLAASFNSAGTPGYTNFTLPASNPFHDSNTHFYIGMVINPSGNSSFPPIVESNYANNSNQGLGLDSAAISVTAQNTGPAPSLSVFGSNPQGSWSQLQFGSVNADGPGSATATQTITLTNTGNAALTVNNIAMDSVGTAAGFKITNIASSSRALPNPLTFPQTMATNAQEEWIVTVVYDPAAATAQTGTLTITTNDPSNPTVAFALNGTGLAVPHLAFTNPVPLNGNVLTANYGGVVLNSTLNETFTLKNSGTSTLTVSANGIVLSDSQGGVWHIASITSTKQGAINIANANTIDPNNSETWTVVVSFLPTVQQPYATNLGIFTNDPLTPAPGVPTVECVLQGQGQVPMSISVASAVSGVTDSNPLIMNFGSTQATGQQRVLGTVTLTNTGGEPLVISSVALGSTTNYQIASIVSNTQGPISLTAGALSIAPSSAETWTINLVFDPTGIGSDNTTLSIASNDPTQATTQVALNGSGLNQQAILVTTPKGGTNLPFGPVLNDGAGNHVGTQTFTIQDIGLLPLAINQNGISLSSAPGYSIKSIFSSTQGTINLASASVNIQPKQAETWTVTVGLDPTGNTSYPGTLNIASQAPLTPNVALTLSGSGVIPTFTLLPTTSSTPLIYIQAGQVYNLSWNGGDTADTAPNAQVVFSRAATNALPPSGLTQLATTPLVVGSTSGSYALRPDPSLVGQEFYIYGAIQDNGVSVGSFSAQKVHVEAAGSFSLISPLITSSGNYLYQYTYDGKTYGGTTTLSAGQNVINITTTLAGGATVVHQITVDKVPSLLSTQGYTYDELKRVKTYTNGNGITTTYTYDPAGNLVLMSADNGDTISYTYNNLQQRVSMTDSTGTTFYDHDDLGRVTAVTYSVNNIKGDGDDIPTTYQYDNASRITQIGYPGGEQVNYMFDDAGRLKTVSDVVNQTTIYNYTYYYDTGGTNSTGHLIKVVRANDVTTNYAYDGSGRLTEITNTNSSNHVLADYLYTLDPNGNATALVTTFNDGTKKQELYTYDSLQRLVEVTYGQTATAVRNVDKTVDYTYDGVGNRLTQKTTVNGTVTGTLTYTYGTENQLQQIKDQTGTITMALVYDSAGNRTQKVTPSGSTYYTYDERNLLTSVLTPSDYVTYTYNGDGHRVGETVDGVSKQFIIYPLQTIFQTIQERSSGAILRNFVYGTERLSLNPASGTSQFYIIDKTSSVRMTTDPSGNVLSSSNYDAFGVPQ